MKSMTMVNRLVLQKWELESGHNRLAWSGKPQPVHDRRGGGEGSGINNTSIVFAGADTGFLPGVGAQ